MKRNLKRYKNEKTIQAQLSTLKMCPFCESYKSVGGDTRYLCSKLDTLKKKDYLGTTLAASSFNKCTYMDMCQCVLLGNHKEPKECSELR